MHPSHTPRWLITAVALATACTGLAFPAPIPSAQAAPPPSANPGEQKGATPSGDDNALPPGIDLGKLDEFERKVFFRVVNRESSACGKGHSLIYSVKHDSACRASAYAVRYVAHLVDSGFTDSEIGEKLEKRFRTPRHARVDVSAAPLKGNASARITIVEFVDYECPHCRQAQTLLRQAVEEYPNDVKMYFKHFPLSTHTNARLAAEGAVAAQKQGKFWPFNEKVWAHMDSLTPAVLEKSAKEIGLDVARWRTDLDSDAVKNRVQSDKTDGNELGVMATPSIFINGRKYEDPLEIASFRDWLNEELGR